MKKILDLAFHVNRKTKLMFFMWVLLTSVELGAFWGLMEPGKYYIVLGPIVGLLICGYGWRGWYIGAKMEQEWMQKLEEANQYFKGLAAHKIHSEQSKTDTL